jgi:predicted P-loop ATPase
MAPGCKVDTMVVLEGKQGARKTTFVETIFSKAWYSEAMYSPASIDFYQSFAGSLGIEIGEMQSFSKAEVGKIKQAITTCEDVYRPSYGRIAVRFPRQSVFVGTTNSDEYLRDETGGRRFLPVRVSEIDIEAIAKVRDQLWAEARVRYDRKEEWYTLPAQAAAEQDSRYQEDSWSDPILRWLEGEMDDSKYPAGVDTKLWRDGGLDGGHQQQLVMSATSTDLLYYALGVDVAKHGKPEQMRVSSIMKRLSWLKERPLIDKRRRWVWKRPQDWKPPA